jgi:hypothetical protein
MKLIGEMVIHKIFGKGEIIGFYQKNLVVNFNDTVGEKTKSMGTGFALLPWKMSK